MSRYRALLLLTVCWLAPATGSAWGWQTPDHQQGLPDPVPPPRPSKPPPTDAVEYEPIVGDSEIPWGLSEELLAPLHAKASVYRDYTRRFSCYETARLASYGDDGEVSKEKLRRYGYLWVKGAVGDTAREFRQEIGKNGNIKPGEVKDEEPFPPAYAWVFLFSRFNEPFFAMRYLGERFDGFDWIHEIQFKGSHPFTDGRDIRQWEGTVLIDAVTHSPLEIRAEPSGQSQRIESLYRHWSKSFNILGMRSAPRPLGFRAQVQFRLREEGLRFPTALRYDTFRAVGINQVVPVKASTRTYDNYRIQKVIATPELGDAVEP